MHVAVPIDRRLATARRVGGPALAALCVLAALVALFLMVSDGSAATLASRGPDTGAVPALEATPRAPVLKVHVTASPATMLLGETTNLTAVVSGGTSWFAYDWMNLPVGCATLNRSSLSCSPLEVGNFTVGVTVTDRVGRNATNTTPLQVTGGPSTPGSTALSPTSVYLFAGVLGVAAAVVTAVVLTVFIRRGRRRPPPTPYSPSPYVPPEPFRES